MRIDLAPRHLHMVQTILQQHLPGQKVWLFGSRADGTAQQNSDIDLCIVNQQALDVETRANLKLAFSESNIPFVVDIVERAATSAKFFESIQNKLVLN